MPQIVPTSNTGQTVGQPVTQVAHGFDIADPVYQMNDGTWQLAQANNLASLKTALVAQPSANTFMAMSYGPVEWPGHGLTPGTLFWLSPIGAGLVQAVAPTAPGQWVQVCYQVTDANNILIVDLKPHQIEEPKQAPRGSLYNLVADTASAYPGTGNMRLNNATPSLVTRIYVAAADAVGSADPALAYLIDGDELYLYDEGGNGYLYEVTLLAINGGLGNYWYDFTVTNFRSMGVTVAPLPAQVRFLGIKATAGVPTAFTQLVDTPNSYSGMGTRLVRVNGAANALEFITDDKVVNTRAVNTATGLSGGGNLTANRTITPAFHNFSVNNNPGTGDQFVFFNAGGTHRRSTLAGAINAIKPSSRNAFRRASISSGDNLDITESDFCIEITNNLYLKRIKRIYDGQVLVIRFRNTGLWVQNNQGNSGEYRQIQLSNGGNISGEIHYPMIFVYNAKWGKFFGFWSNTGA